MALLLPKKIKSFLLLAILFIGCERPEWKYRIEGEVRVAKKSPPYLYNGRPDSITVKSIWMTDTFRVQNDTIFIDNSDGSKYVIPEPYKIFQVSK